MTKKKKDIHKRVNVALSDEISMEATKIGNGNRSLGIAIAISHLKAHNTGEIQTNEGFIKYKER